MSHKSLTGQTCQCLDKKGWATALLVCHNLMCLNNNFAMRGQRMAGLPGHEEACRRRLSAPPTVHCRSRPIAASHAMKSAITRATAQRSAGQGVSTLAGYLSSWALLISATVVARSV